MISPNSHIEHQNFIDWMKAAGMFIIVFGHVVGPPFNQFTQPIFPKQLGVAFFVFITGWSLANDARPRLRVLFNRLFPVYLYGLGAAILLSLLFLFTKGDTNPSNYLPFFLGANVFVNFFPANPTTWYIGTYLHLLLFWFFFLQKRKIRIPHLLLAFVFEIFVRAMLMANGKLYIAYMILPNWLIVFLLGRWMHDKKDIQCNRYLIFFLIASWAVLFFGWASLGNSIGFGNSFPFRNVIPEFQLAIILRSLLISLLYCIHTLLFFSIARYLPNLRTVSLLSRNTLIIFIIHMPVLYECSPFIYSLFDSKWPKKLTMICILYFGLAILSEMIQKKIRAKMLREKVWSYFYKKLCVE